MALEVKWITEATGTNYPRDTAAPIVIHLVYRSFLTVACGSGVCEERRDEPIETETGEQRNRGTG